MLEKIFLMVFMFDADKATKLKPVNTLLEFLQLLFISIVIGCYLLFLLVFSGYNSSTCYEDDNDWFFGG